MSPLPCRLIAGQSLRFVLREHIVAFLVLLFVSLVMMSAWLGWSATSTVDHIYTDAAAFLAASNQPVPTNPVLDISPLSLMRNMSIYVALIGVLASIVIGNQLVSLDRKSGVVPLIATRALSLGAYAAGKVLALTLLVLGLTAITAMNAVATFALLPGTSLSATGWLQLLGFFGVSALYLLIFGLLSLGCAALSRSESVALLIPVTIWLTLTFILPSLTGNIHPTAAINPIAALAPPPDSAFFQWAGWLLGPVSLAENYKFAAAQLLDFLPPDHVSRTFIAPVPDLLVASVLAAAFAVTGLSTMDHARSDYDV